MNHFKHLLFYLMLIGLGQAFANGPINPGGAFDLDLSADHPTNLVCSVTTDSCSITISDLSSTDYTKVFDASWQIIWDCNPWANGGCSSTETITGLNSGTYWVQACGQTTAYTIVGCSPTNPCANQGGDTDGDGICNNQDCQPNNPAYPAIPGTACNDGNPNTINDLVTADGCGCAGTPATGGPCSVSTDGCVITISGLDGSEYIKVFNASWQIQWDCNPWANGGCNPTETVSGLPTGNYYVQACGSNQLVTITGCGQGDPCANQGGDSDGDGICNNQDCQPNNPAYPATPGTACNDGNPNTTNDVITVDGCGCAGVVANPCANQGGDSDGDGICNNQDCQPNNPAYPATPGTACNDGNPNTTNDVVTADGCGCAGTPVGGACTVSTDGCVITISGLDGSEHIKVFNALWQIQWDCNPWVNGGCNPTEIVTGLPAGNYYVQACGSNQPITLTGCGQADPCVNQGGDSDGDGVCNNQDCQPNNPAYPATPGTACNDGNPNTTNDVVTADGCGCAGVVANPCANQGGDSDGDSVCDNEDCQPYNPAFPATPGTPCNDGNPNTINDVVAANGCGCAGQITTPPCNWTQHDHSNFESNYGFWIDGGADCDRTFLQGANGSLWAIELEDSGSDAAMYTPALDLSAITDIKFDFLYKGQGMDNGEKLMLEYSVNGGSSYAVIQEWIKGIHFSNGSYISESVSFSHTFSANTKFRFRCHASSALDKVYLDDVIFSMCEDVPFDPYANQRPMYRTFDGSLNNFDHPDWGKANIPLYREIPAAYGDGQNSLAGQNRPSPRHISNQLSDEPEDRRDERLLSGMAYQFGQFLDHDIVLSEGGNEPAPIQVPGYDPIFTPNSVIPFTRSAAIPGSSPREQANIITAYIDASNVYGSDPARAAWLRTFQDGKLKTSKGNLLPYNTIDGEFDSPGDPNAPRMDRDRKQDGSINIVVVAGDFRANEHPNLTAFHTVFVREHNRLCDQIKSSGETDDEVIYQKARKIVGAMMQRIVYEEFLPSFGVSLSPYHGYDSNARPDIRNIFATAAYRWHTMVENDIILRNDLCEGVAGVELPLKTIFFNPSIIRKYGPGVLLQGLAFHPQYRTDLKVNNGLRNFLFGQGAGFDLVSINLQRGRDHGLPDYKTVRQHYGLGSISSFSDINSDSHISSKLQQVYGNVNDIDLWAGMFGEPLVSGTSLSATAIAIIKKQFELLRDGDFYFYKNDPFLSSSDMSIVNSSKLADIIERNTSARSIPSNIFFKPPCVNNDPLEDLKDNGNPVCSGNGATFYTSCSSTSGSNKNVGTYSGSGIRKIKINLGFAVRVYTNQGEIHYYTDDTGCLPAELQNNISSIEVVCLSNDDSAVDCSSFAGALFSSCFSSPLPIFTPGKYNLEQLKSLNVSNDDIEAIRVHKGFKVTLYEHDNFQGAAWEYVGPTVLCLPASQKNKMSSMKVVCLSDPDRSNCGFNGIAGAIFQKHANDVNSHIGVSVGVGDYNTSRMIAMGAGNDNTKQIKVNNGYAITLFEHDNFGGNYTVYMGHESDLSTTITETTYPIWDILGLFPYTNTITMNDKTSSMKVRCIESLQSSPLVAESVLDLRAERAGEQARLDVSYIFSKEVIFLRIEKYDGKLGDFDILHDFTTDRIEDIYTYYDEEPSPGDNIYRVKVFYADDTEAETAYRTVRFPWADNFTVYPNPAINIVNVELEKYLGQAVDVVIYDMLGVEVAAQRFDELTTAEISFDISNVLGGTYIIRVTADGRKGASKKLTIVKP